MSRRLYACACRSCLPLPVRPEFLITFLISRAKSLNYSRFAGFRFLLWFVCVIPTDDRGTGKRCANADPELVDHPENAPMVSWMGQVTGEIHAVNKRLKRLAITFRTGKVNPLLAAGAFHRFPFSAVLFLERQGKFLLRGGHGPACRSFDNANLPGKPCSMAGASAEVKLTGGE